MLCLCRRSYSCAAGHLSATADTESIRDYIDVGLRGSAFTRRPATGGGSCPPVFGLYGARSVGHCRLVHQTCATWCLRRANTVFRNSRRPYSHLCTTVTPNASMIILLGLFGCRCCVIPARRSQSAAADSALPLRVWRGLVYHCIGDGIACTVLPMTCHDADWSYNEASC